MGAFRCKTNVPVQYIDMLVLRRMDRISYRLVDALEGRGWPSFVTAAQETDWSYKRASYGRLSTRHLGIEAGLGTFGLEVNILTPEFGPRIYLTGVLTECELEADEPMTEQVCIGESCSRCLYSCPSDAVRHFGIDKRACATEAQEFGFTTILKFWEHFLVSDGETRRRLMSDRGYTVSGRGCSGSWARSATAPAARGSPVGNDYHAHLAPSQKVIPEKTPEKVDKAKAFKDARKSGAEIDGLNDWNLRWVGPEGYKESSRASSRPSRPCSASAKKARRSNRWSACSRPRSTRRRSSGRRGRSAPTSWHRRRRGDGRHPPTRAIRSARKTSPSMTAAGDRARQALLRRDHADRPLGRTPQIL